MSKTLLTIGDTESFLNIYFYNWHNRMSLEEKLTVNIIYFGTWKSHGYSQNIVIIFLFSVAPKVIVYG